MALSFHPTSNRLFEFSVRKAVAVALVIATFSACTQQIPEEIRAEYNGLPEKIDFNFHVRPILTDRCYACHGPDQNKRKAGFRLDLEEMAKEELPENPGNRAIVPGKPGKSKLVERIISHDADLQMPPPESNLSLSNEEKATLIKWIEQGAEWKEHWAFLPPEK